MNFSQQWLLTMSQVWIKNKIVMDVRLLTISNVNCKNESINRNRFASNDSFPSLSPNNYTHTTTPIQKSTHPLVF